MPFINPETRPDIPESILPPAEFAQPAPDPEMGVLTAAFGRENVAVNLLRSAFEPDVGDYDPEHNPFDIVEGTVYGDVYLDRFIESRNETETRQIMSRIDREMKQDEALEAAGWLGTVASMGASIIDLPSLLPGGAIVTEARTGATLARSMAALRSGVSVGAAAAAGAAAGEVALQATQETRPLAESFMNIGFATILGGVLGGSVGLLSSTAKHALIPRIAEDMGPADPRNNRLAPAGKPNPDIFEPGGLGTISAAGAINVRTDVPAIKRFGLEKVVRFADPIMRVMSATSVAGRRIAEQMAELPYRTEANVAGQTGVHGFDIKGNPIVHSVETMMAQWTGRKAIATREMDNLYSRYRYGRDKSLFKADILRGEATARLGKSEGKLGYSEFKRAVGNAMRRGDEHEIPEVAAAAKMWRKDFYEPFKNDAVDLGLLPEGVTVETAESFLNRLYNTDRIVAERSGPIEGGGPSFKTVIRGWLDEQMQHNANVQQTLRTLTREHKTTTGDIRSLERRIERRSATADKVAARREEASRLNKFAYQRSEKLSRPIDEIRANIESITDKIQEELDGIEAFTDEIRAVRQEIPGLIEVESTIQRLSRGLSGLRKDADLIDVVEANDEIAEGIADLKARVKPVMAEFRATAKSLRADTALGELEKARAALGKEIKPFRTQLKNLRKQLREELKRKKPRAAEGAVFETQARNRVNTLADQESGRRAAIDDLQANLDAKKARLDELETRIKEETASFNGNRGRAAEKVEGKKLLRLARSIARDFNFDDIDVDDLADQIIDRIISTPAGRLHYDAAAHGDMNVRRRGSTETVGLRGSLKGRVFNIPDELIEPWLESDIDVLSHVMARSLGADIELMRRFGEVEVGEKSIRAKEIVEEYARLAENAPNAAARTKLNKERNAVLRDLKGMNDRLRGTYALPTNPDGIVSRGARAVVSLNYLRLLGGMTLSAIPDLARIVMVHGLTRTFRDGFVPMIKNFNTIALARAEAQRAGTALDWLMDTRTMAMADLMEDYGRHSGPERLVKGATANFGIVSLMAPWNSALKQFSSLITINKVLGNAETLAKGGELSPGDLEAMASLNIDANMARRIWETFEAGGGVKDSGSYIPNTQTWGDGLEGEARANARTAADALLGAIKIETDRVIVTPGQEKPLMTSTELGRVFFQFKSFALASTQRTLVAGLQQRDAAVINGAMLALSLGALTYYVKETAAGRDIASLTDDPEVWAAEAFDRSGLAGWFMEANNIAEKATRGTVGLSALTGKQLSRYASRNAAGALLGPTFGATADFLQATGNLAAGDFRASDTRAVRRLLPYQNLFYVRQLLDEVEGAVNSAFGIPERKSRGDFN